MRLRPLACSLLLLPGPSAWAESDHPAAPRPQGHGDPRAELLEVVAARESIDAYQSAHYQVAPGLEPAPREPDRGRRQPLSHFRIVEPELDPDLFLARKAVPASILPPLGHRALILDHAGFPPAPATADVEPETARAQRLVRSRLVTDGLLSVLADLIELAGPERVCTNETALLDRLRAAGFPTDLIRHFAAPADAASTSRPHGTIGWIARRLVAGDAMEAVKSDLAGLPFQFRPARPDYSIALELGEWDPVLVRMQAGGGYQDGIVPGGSLDVINQVVSALAEPGFLITIPAEHLDAFVSMARVAWPLSRPEQATLMASPNPVSTWAQDNGKPGTMDGAPATLTPRFASLGELETRFVPGESYLMEGLAQSGHPVVQSSLLFQGGNLMAIRDPRTGQRLLLIGEAEVHRNMALGLSQPQVMEAFRREFNVDRCIVWPAGSYHLDFDVTFRRLDNRLVAFVNDPFSAAREVVRVGLSALGRQGSLEGSAIEEMQALLAQGGEVRVAREIRRVLGRFRTSSEEAMPFSLSRFFTSDPVDSAAHNLQCFLVALDILESSQPAAAEGEGERASYLAALRTLEAAGQRQRHLLEELGCTVIPVPSMPDVNHGLNYINGVALKDRYLMPAFGGFYASVDAAATRAFRAALPDAIKVLPIQAAEAQRHHGGVHCAVSIYPGRQSTNKNAQ